MTGAAESRARNNSGWQYPESTSLHKVSRATYLDAPSVGPLSFLPLTFIRISASDTWLERRSGAARQYPAYGGEADMRRCPFYLDGFNRSAQQTF